MTIITVLPKYPIVIPKAFRDLLGLRPGQRFQAIAYAGRIELIPVRRLKEMRAFLRGIDTSIGRESDRASRRRFFAIARSPGRPRPCRP